MAQNIFGPHLPAALILEKKRLNKNTIYTSKTTIGEANNSNESIRWSIRQYSILRHSGRHHNLGVVSRVDK